MEQNVKEAVRRLSEDSRASRIRGRVIVSVMTDDLEKVLDRLAELEEQVAEAPVIDTTSVLEVGDEVVAMIRYMEVMPGTKGKVVAVKPKAEYPVEVQFDGIKFMYLNNGVLGFKREELGKVKK